MFKRVLGLLVVVALFCSSVAVAGEPGIPESSQRVMLKAAPQEPPVYQPAPVYKPSAVWAPQACPPPVTNCAAYAPYEVSVQYTPLQPQPGECTYCTVLPYGCPDGSPMIGGCNSCGSCGTAPCVASSYGSCGWNGFGIFGAVGNLADGIVNVGLCVGGSIYCGTLNFASGILDCLAKPCNLTNVCCAQ